MRLGAAAAVRPKELEDHRFRAMIDNDFDTLDQLPGDNLFEISVTRVDVQLGRFVGSPEELSNGSQDRFAQRMDRGAKGASC